MLSYLGYDTLPNGIDIYVSNLDNKKIEEVIGEVLVIDDPKEVSDCIGKILVTKMTDPGWVFLLVNSKGVISEKGSLLSHTAIISREIKIPSIVGVEDATTIIKTGDYLRMDATTGRIEILKRRRK